jgi:transcriptional regulator with XRE-family HTH domain
MNSGFLLRSARRAADLSQAELAKRAGTTQPAVAAYETGARTPGLKTLERLLGSCDFDVDLVVTPHQRRGAASLFELSGLIRADLAVGTERGARDATRLLFGFADDFRGSPRPGKLALIETDPPSTADLRFDAALAGLAEYFAAEAGLPAPSWASAPGRFVEPWWFVTDRPAFHAYVLASSPAAFSRHGVFIAREAFDRA